MLTWWGPVEISGPVSFDEMLDGLRQAELGFVCHEAEETLLLQKRTQRQGQYIYELLRRQRITPRQILETSNIRAAFALAVNGYGAAFISGGLLRHFDQSIAFDRYLLADSPPLDFVAAWRKGSYLPGYAQDFIRLMQEV